MYMKSSKNNPNQGKTMKTNTKTNEYLVVVTHTKNGRASRLGKLVHPVLDSIDDCK